MNCPPEQIYTTQNVRSDTLLLLFISKESFTSLIQENFMNILRASKAILSVLFSHIGGALSFNSL